ncbi:MAG: hypothetical protein HY687_05790 [Chloroflexi bacterium]|nr:hypothetical protein [Chloroflexota bacterium]
MSLAGLINKDILGRVLKLAVDMGLGYMPKSKKPPKPKPPPPGRVYLSSRKRKRYRQ